jgi:hypothetical protein
LKKEWNMRFNTHPLQKFIAFATMILAIIALSFSPVNADTPAAGSGVCNDQTSCLQLISQNVYATLQQLNTLPDFLNNAAVFILNLTSADTSDTTAQLQTTFTGIGNDIATTNAYTSDPSNILNVTAAALQVSVNQFSAGNNAPAPILTTIPNVNDLAYSTILGMPPVPNTNSNPSNYIVNAAGLQFPHIAPSSSWRGRDKATYGYYYNTIMAAQTFNAYILNNLVAENVNGNQFSTLQTNLISEASSAAWLATISSEEIGKVLRQILMFQSQNYLLMTQLIQTQKQLLTAQVMGNSLAVVMNQDKENYLATKAQGLKPLG